MTSDQILDKENPATPENKIDRRTFVKASTFTLGAFSLIGTSTILSACSSDEDAQTSASTSKLSPTVNAVRVSSDLHNSELEQRVAFSVFDNDRKIVAQDSTNVVLTSPSGKIQNFKDVELRDEGIKDRGIFSFLARLNETGPWNLKATHKSKSLELAFSVADENAAPFTEELIPTVDTPTNSSPLDAKILCTRFEGECGLHKKSVPQLLSEKKPFVVLFATPARCATNYCGPVLDLAIDVKKDFEIDIIHIEIYQDDVSSSVLEAVTKWNLPSEPWMFGVNADGKVTKRLDGAFDKSEIRDLFSELTTG